MSSQQHNSPQSKSQRTSPEGAPGERGGPIPTQAAVARSATQDTQRPGWGERRLGYVELVGLYEPNGKTKLMAQTEFFDGMQLAMRRHEMMEDDLYINIARGFQALLANNALGDGHERNRLISLSADMQACFDVMVESECWDEFPMEEYVRRNARSGKELRALAPMLHALIDLLAIHGDLSREGAKNLHDTVTNCEQTMVSHRVWAKPRRGLPRAMN